MVAREEWAEIELGQLGTVITGRTPPKAEPELFGGDYPFVTPSDMSYGDRSPPTERFISEAGAERFRRIRLPAGSTCFVCIGATIGKTCLTSRPSFTNQQLNSIVPDTRKHDPRFVYYLLVSVVDEIKSLASGAATPIINKSSFSAFKVKVPSLRTQERIAAILSAYDDLIENNTRRIEILEEMARRLYEEWFVHFRFPWNEDVELVESELGMAPDGWSVLPMQDLCSKITDGAHKSPKSTDVGRPMASVKDMHDWGFSIEKCRRISEDDYQELVRNNCRPLVGDVVIAKDGSYLKHTFAIEKELDLVLLSSVAILRPNEKVISDLLAIALRHPDVVARMKGIVSGVAIPRIVLKDFRAFKIIVPPPTLQLEWIKRAGPMLTLCRRLVEKNSNLRAQRDLLLPKLVTGEIDVSEAEAGLEAAE